MKKWIFLRSHRLIETIDLGFLNIKIGGYLLILTYCLIKINFMCIYITFVLLECEIV